MKPKKAIKILSKSITCSEQNKNDCCYEMDCDDCQYNVSDEDLLKAMKVAISALEKQVRPVNPWMASNHMPKTDLLKSIVCRKENF